MNFIGWLDVIVFDAIFHKTISPCHIIQIHIYSLITTSVETFDVGESIKLDLSLAELMNIMNFSRPFMRVGKSGSSELLKRAWTDQISPKRLLWTI